MNISGNSSLLLVNREELPSPLLKYNVSALNQNFRDGNKVLRVRHSITVKLLTKQQMQTRGTGCACTALRGYYAV